MKSAIIMAAGKGTRMKSHLPKTMHKLCDKPMVGHIVDNLKAAGAERLVTVVGYGAEVLQEYLQDKTEYALQQPQLGTGHAVMQATQLKEEDGITLVVNGDCPLISKETFKMMYDNLKDNAMLVLTAVLPEGKQYGRVVVDENMNLSKIVEYKDCNDEELSITEINTGIYAFNNKDLFANLTKLSQNNQQQEYYITDLVAILKNQGKKVKAIRIADYQEASGINDPYELHQANRWLQQKINKQHMLNGVIIVNSDNTYISADATIGAETVIYPNTYILGKTKIGVGCTIMSSYLDNSQIGDRCHVEYGKITDSQLGNDITVGPFAHLRNNCVIEDHNRIGNFVEIKNSHFKDHTKCAHLTYIGDSEIGSRVNIGCGVVTVNYDGAHKFKTVVGDDAFIGSNVNIIAPVTVGDKAVLAAGSTITDDVEAGAMAIARSHQTTKPGYGIKYKNKGKE